MDFFVASLSNHPPAKSTFMCKKFSSQGKFLTGTRLSRAQALPETRPIAQRTGKAGQ
jgi:hypothetical protein